jgi:hypothetical protein
MSSPVDDNLVGPLTAAECPQRPEQEQTESMTNMEGTVVALGETTKPTNGNIPALTIFQWIGIATPRPSGATEATSDMAAAVDCEMTKIGLMIDTMADVDGSRVVSEAALPHQVADDRAEIGATPLLHPHQHHRLHRHLPLPAEIVVAVEAVVDLVRTNWLGGTSTVLPCSNGSG